MYPPARRSLCHICREDLLQIFEAGFATQARAKTSRQSFHLRPTLQPLQRDHHVRNFGGTRWRREATSTARPADPKIEAESESSLGSHLPIDPEAEALPETVVEEGSEIWVDAKIDPEIQVETEAEVGEELEAEMEAEATAELVNPVESIRNAEGRIEDVVREARNLHGEYLPEGLLSEDEFKMYKRLYGEPAEMAEEVREPLERDREEQHLLGQDGDMIGSDRRRQYDGWEETLESTGLDWMEARKDRSDDPALEAAEQVGGELRLYSDYEAIETAVGDRTHPFTVIGRSQTSPSTLFLPKDSFLTPIQRILSEYSNKHVKEMAQRLFGGPGLPDSSLTPAMGRALPQKPISLDASQHAMGAMEANAYISVIWPGTFAAITNVLVETRKRLGAGWLQNLLVKQGGPSVLDAGGGGVAVLAWQEILKAEWRALHSSDASPPPAPLGKSTVLAGSETLRHRSASLLENTTFLPRLPDYVHVRDGSTLADDTPITQRKQYDVIIAPHTLWSLQEEWQRKQQIQNLWYMLNPEGGVLIILEKGVPRGFEVVAGARQFLLDRYIATVDAPSYESQLESSTEDGAVLKGKGAIIAPCTNHVTCPMYTVSGVSQGRKNFCSFQQRYIRPSFLQRILGAKDRNHDDVNFSYLTVQKGKDLNDVMSSSMPLTPSSLPFSSSTTFPSARRLGTIQGKEARDVAFGGYEKAGMDKEEAGKEEQEAEQENDTTAFHPLNLPRLVFSPIKRQGHVTMDVCTPAGKIDRWTVPKSFSKTAYRDARKASWGDLWALGAKTSVSRSLQLGGEHSKKAQRERKLQGRAQEIRERMEEDRIAGAEMEDEFEQVARDAEQELAFGSGGSRESEGISQLDADTAGEVEIDHDAAQILKDIQEEKLLKRRKKQRRNVGASKEETPQPSAHYLPAFDDRPSSPPSLNSNTSPDHSTPPLQKSNASSTTNHQNQNQSQNLNQNEERYPVRRRTRRSSKDEHNNNSNSNIDPIESSHNQDLDAEARLDAQYSRANTRLMGNLALNKGGRGSRRSSNQKGGKMGRKKRDRR